ncbi:MAG: undecaprenyl-diphosphate phosphatase [Candidatus Omnitrophica bacterium]|nr:undecaprenyl-diphosphate phosphatase [Candidatus Omnitrophota bacterium]
MTIAQAMILGAVQGITEFFPISSSGHLVVLQSLLGLKEEFAFDVFLHLGTTAAILIYFRKEVTSLLTDIRSIALIVAASVPTFIIGLSFKDAVEKFFGMPNVVGYMLVLTGILLLAASFYERFMLPRRGLGFINSVIIGIAQGIAVMPGISRSGTTIGTGMLCGIDKEKAFRFSFLLAIPAVLGASVLKLHKIGQGIAGKDAGIFIAGGLVAMAVGLAAIRILFNALIRNKLYIFGIYCVLAGALIIIFI